VTFVHCIASLRELARKMNDLVKTAVKKLIPRSLNITRLRPNAKDAILLTFDDGPHPVGSPAVLDVLRKYEARAIFFLVGKSIRRAPEVVRRILDEGHSVGNHTFSHPNDRQMPYQEYRNDLLKCQEMIFDYSGIYPWFHRPPLGQLTVASLFAPKKLGLLTITWSCSADDWCFHSEDAAVRRADEMVAEVEARDIIVFHDEQLYSSRALERLLAALKARGFCLSPDLELLV